MKSKFPNGKGRRKVDTRLASDNGEEDPTVLGAISEAEYQQSESSPSRAFSDGNTFLSWLKHVFGIKQPPLSSTANKVIGVNISAALQALDTDVANGVGVISVDLNVDHCVAAGMCFTPDDPLTVQGYMSENPPNYPSALELFNDRGWQFRTILELQE
jgi:hypothetical protein